jgi:hypothetical protein
MRRVEGDGVIVWVLFLAPEVWMGQEEGIERTR